VSREVVEGESAAGRISDVDVLLSLSRIIGRCPISLTRVDVKQKKNC